MTSTIGCKTALTCHSATPNPLVRGIDFEIRRLDSGTIAFTFSLEGEVARILVPPPRAPRRLEGLWQHTCFEVFIALKDEAAYHEFNFSPSGEWAAYAFRSYRDGAPLARDSDPEIKVRCTENRLELEAVIGVDCLPPMQPCARLLVGLAAVIEEEGGVLSYWALKHPPGKPDFHHPESFALEFEISDLQSENESVKVKR